MQQTGTLKNLKRGAGNSQLLRNFAQLSNKLGLNGF